MAKRKEPVTMKVNRIAAIRRSMHMTQAEFAEYCHVSRATIARCERGEHISLQTARCIADALKISIDEVVNPVIHYSVENTGLSSQKIQKLAEGYSGLNEVGRQNVDQFIDYQASINSITKS